MVTSLPGGSHGRMSAALNSETPTKCATPSGMRSTLFCKTVRADRHSLCV